MLLVFIVAGVIIAVVAIIDFSSIFMDKETEQLLYFVHNSSAKTDSTTNERRATEECGDASINPPPIQPSDAEVVTSASKDVTYAVDVDAITENFMEEVYGNWKEENEDTK